MRGVTSSPAEPGPRPPSWGLGARLHCTVWGLDLAMETVGLVFHPQGRTRSPNLEVTQMSFKQQMDKPRPRPQPNTARLRDGERRAPDTPRHLHLGRSHPLRQHKAGSDARGTATFDTGTHQAAPLLGSGSRGTALETLTQPRPEVLKSQRDREGGRSWPEESWPSPPANLVPALTPPTETTDPSRDRPELCVPFRLGSAPACGAHAP